MSGSFLTNNIFFEIDHNGSADQEKMEALAVPTSGCPVIDAEMIAVDEAVKI